MMIVNVDGTKSHVKGRRGVGGAANGALELLSLVALGSRGEHQQQNQTRKKPADAASTTWGATANERGPMCDVTLLRGTERR